MAGRSAGSAFIARRAYADRDLVEFAMRSAELWSEWEREFGAVFVRRRQEHRAPFRRQPRLTIPGVDDGVQVAHAGPVTAIWGNDRFGLAPAIAELTAGVLLEDAGSAISG